ncbi:hypothetical protein Trydic_g3337 [Trypoxylus dichotomus]
MYIEHIGHGKISKGTFRIELQYNYTKLMKDVISVNETVQQMASLCEKTKRLVNESSCDYLLPHLIELKDKVLWIKNSLDNFVHRQRRGLIGKFLTALFGVNDEVYQDIDALDKNQQRLINTSHYHTKFLFSTVSDFNKSEEMINKKLQHFQSKLNTAIATANYKSSFFRSIDKNQLQIKVLLSHQTASNYIEEIIHHYMQLLNVQMRRGDMYDLISPNRIREIVSLSSKKIPQNLRILSMPLLNTKVVRNQDMLCVFGYFPVIENTDFVILKVTPIPLRIESNSYWIFHIPTEVIAVDYNSQLYFSLSKEELVSSIVLEDNVNLYFPRVLKKIENKPSCILDEIYQRTENYTCKIQKYNITSVIWKELYTSNSWMFITHNETKITVTCNGIPQNVTIYNAGIVQISQSCFIETNKNILTARREENIRVLATYTKYVPAQINVTVNYALTNISTIEDEPVLRPFHSFEDLQEQEKPLQDQEELVPWKHVKYHPVVPYIITGACVLLLILIAFIAYRTFKACSTIPCRTQEAQFTEAGRGETQESSARNLPR